MPNVMRGEGCLQPVRTIWQHMAKRQLSGHSVAWAPHWQAFPDADGPALLQLESWELANHS